MSTYWWLGRWPYLKFILREVEQRVRGLVRDLDAASGPGLDRRAGSLRGIPGLVAEPDSDRDERHQPVLRHLSRHHLVQSGPQSDGRPAGREAPSEPPHLRAATMSPGSWYRRLWPGSFCEVECSKRSNEPFLWLLFSAGGVVAALLIPIQLFPVRAGVSAGMAERARVTIGCWLWLSSPLGRECICSCCASLPLFHWAHRFRYTLYDGLQIKHLNELINTFCYGGAIVGSAIAIYLVFRLP